MNLWHQKLEKNQENDKNRNDLSVENRRVLKKSKQTNNNKKKPQTHFPINPIHVGP